MTQPSLFSWNALSWSGGIVSSSMTLKTESGSTPNCANGIISSLYLPPYQLNGVAATTPSSAATSLTLAIGTMPANPLALSVTIRL